MDKIRDFRCEIQTVLDDYKDGKIKDFKAVNEILRMFIIEEVYICPICKTTILIDGMCPRCTIDLCSPPDKPIIL